MCLTLNWGFVCGAIWPNLSRSKDWSVVGQEQKHLNSSVGSQDSQYSFHYDDDDDEGFDTNRSPTKSRKGSSPLVKVKSPKAVGEARLALARLQQQLDANREQRRQVTSKIKNIQDNNKALKTEVVSRLRSSDRVRTFRLSTNESMMTSHSNLLFPDITSIAQVELLELELRQGLLELQNMELEQSKMMHQNIIEEKDTLIERLRLQLEVRRPSITTVA